MTRLTWTSLAMAGTFLMATPVLALGLPGMGNVPLQKFAPQHAEAVASCPNLAGSWVGQCVNSNGETHDEQLLIGQEGCSEIIFGSEGFKVGSSRTQSDSSSDGLEQVLLDLDWNSDQTVLVGEAQLRGRNFDQDGDQKYQGILGMRMRKDGDMLVSDTIFDVAVTFGGGDISFKDHVNCRYAPAQ